MAKTKTLNVRLLRKGHAIANAFTESFAPDAERALEQRPWNGIEGASLFIGQIYSNTPGWRTFLETGSPDLPGDIFTGGADAVFFLPLVGRVCARCFGHGPIALYDRASARPSAL